MLPISSSSNSDEFTDSMDCPSDRADQLDRLPDELLLDVLNRVRDARSLTRCLAVSKRLAPLVPLVSTVSLPIPQRSAPPPCPKQPARGFPFGLLAKAARFVRRAISAQRSGSGSPDGESYHNPHEILRVFSEVRELDLEIPIGGTEIGMKNDDGLLLRWDADFGAELNSCTIFGANSLERKHRDDDAASATEPNEAQPVLTEKDLKLRVVWIISCLIAAASRHLLLKDIIEENPALEDAQITDAGRQGKLRMGKEQIAEVRSSAGPETKKLDRSVVPDLKMKLWFVPEMELPETGFVMKGATLVAIRPAKEEKKRDICSADDVEGLLNDWFGCDGDGDGDGDDRGKAFGEAARELRKMKMKMKRSFTLEMNSF